jgi:hypothetical protein
MSKRIYTFMNISHCLASGFTVTRIFRCMYFVTVKSPLRRRHMSRCCDVGFQTDRGFSARRAVLPLVAGSSPSQTRNFSPQNIKINERVGWLQRHVMSRHCLSFVHLSDESPGWHVLVQRRCNSRPATLIEYLN